MRNIFEKSTFKWIIAWFFVCLLFWVVVFADWTNLKSFRNTWWSDAPNIENKLSAETWNSVLQELDQLKLALSWALNDPSIAIPKWAVMAFDLTTWCPTGWEPFTLANGKFLLWTLNASEVEKTWWSSTAQLQVKNLPSHYHYYKDTIYAESHPASHLNNYVSYNYSNASSVRVLAQWTNDVKWSRNGQEWVIYWSDEWWDHDNFPIYWVRATSNDICEDGFWWDSVWQYGGRDSLGWRFIGLNWELTNLRNSYCYWSTAKSSAQAFSVQNPYIKILYCKKK